MSDDGYEGVPFVVETTRGIHVHGPDAKEDVKDAVVEEEEEKEEDNECRLKRGEAPLLIFLLRRVGMDKFVNGPDRVSSFEAGIANCVPRYWLPFLRIVRHPDFAEYQRLCVAHEASRYTLLDKHFAKLVGAAYMNTEMTKTVRE